MLVQRLKKFQEKFVCLINLTNPNIVDHLFKDSNILKLTDFIKHKYVQFIRNSLRKVNIPIFNEVYTTFNQIHVYNTKRINKSNDSCTKSLNYSLRETYSSKSR